MFVSFFLYFLINLPKAALNFYLIKLLVLFDNILGILNLKKSKSVSFSSNFSLI